MVNGDLATIDNIMRRIRTHPEYSVCVSRNFVNSLRKEAYKHSSEIERTLEDSEGDVFKNLENARDYLSREGISLTSLSRLGHLVQPTREGSKTPDGFRYTEINLQYAPVPNEILHQMDNLVYFLEHSDVHPIRKATEAHLRVAMIQPYIDGNKRSGRLLQNYCLEQAGYPPAVILEDEKTLYINILKRAILDRFEGKSSSENPSDAENFFINFNDARVLISARELEEELRKNRIYEVSLSHVKNKNIVYALANSLKAHGQRNGGLKVKVGAKNHTKFDLRVQGNMGLDEITTYVSKSSQKNRFSFYVKPITSCH